MGLNGRVLVSGFGTPRREVEAGKRRYTMKMSKILLAVIALVVLVGTAVPSEAAVHHRHHHHHHHRHA